MSGKEKGTLIKAVNLQETVFYTGLVMSRTFDLKSLQRESEEIPSISKFQSLQKLPSLQVLHFIMSLSDSTMKMLFRIFRQMVQLFPV